MSEIISARNVISPPRSSIHSELISTSLLKYIELHPAPEIKTTNTVGAENAYFSFENI